MDNSINSYSICDFPTHLLQNITICLPFWQKCIILPRVNKKWNENFSKDYEKTFLKLIKFSANEFFSDKEINFVKDLVVHNSFIPILKNQIHYFELQEIAYPNYRIKIVFQDKEVILPLNGLYTSSSYYSNVLKIDWNPENPLLLNKQLTTYSSHKHYEIEVGVDNFDYNKKTLIHFFSLKIILKEENKNKEYVKPLYMENMIKLAIDFQLKIYIDYAVELNMEKLENFLLNEFTKEKTFWCTKDGYISQDIKRKFCVLTIQKLEIKTDLYVFGWKSTDYKLENCTVDDFLRWAIFSTTTKKLAKKLGCEITSYHLAKE